MSNNLGKKSRSILEEINSFVPSKNIHETIDARANHVIISAINILRLINENYSPEEAEELTKRFLSSIRGEDPARFSRRMKKIKESKQ